MLARGVWAPSLNDGAPYNPKGVSKMRLREWDCGVYDAKSEFGRVTVRERADGRFDVVHVRYERTAQGLVKSERAVGVYSDLVQAKNAGWELSRALDSSRRSRL
jgi:homoserine trans-succinylase